jgi:hypothetical protein
LDSQADGTVFRNPRRISQQHTSLTDTRAGGQIEGAFMQWTNQRRAAYETVRERSSAVRAIRLGSEHPPGARVKNGHGSPSNLEAAALADGDQVQGT